MVELGIPARYRPGLAVLLQLDDRSVDELITALGETPPGPSTSVFATTLATRIKTISREEIGQVLDSLLSLHMLQVGQELSAAEVAEAICDAIERGQGGDLAFDHKRRAGFEAQLKALLAVQTLVFQAKANSVLAEHANVFVDARVLSDIRPIFGDDPEERPIGMKVIHSLKLEYLRNGDFEEVFIALDRDDLDRLNGVVERAQQKARSLSSIIAVTGVQNLDA